MERVAFYTLGCKVNQYDTETMIGQFEEAGYRIVDFDEQADIYIINTCTVTHQGARKSRKMARRARRKNSKALIAVVGCYPQVDPEEVLESAELDLIVGTTGRSKIVELVEQAKKANQPLNFVQSVDDKNEFEEIQIEDFKGRTRASIKIQEGCDQFCSYCIIPYARGGLRSRKLQNIVTEVKKLAKHGFKEIVLTGIHLGEYGKDQPDLSLEKLLKELIKIDDIARIRLSSIEGTEVSDGLIDLIANSPKICRHLHLPLQSGSNKILESMNRPYKRESFKKMVKKIRNKVPKIAITTDVIVGFPGETEEDFNATYQLMKELKFSDAHVFKYSKREGTPAAKFDQQIHSKVKKARSKKLRDLTTKLVQNYHQQFIGNTLEVLIEEERDKKTGLLTGLTDNYLRVFVDGSDHLKGELVTVNLQKKEGELVGHLESNQ